MKKTAIASLLIAGAMSFGTAQAAGNAEAGKAKSSSCAACHGADGNSAAPNFPKLAGQHEGYLLKQLIEFKSGDRTDPTMSAMVAPLSEQDMADLAAFFAAQSTKPGVGDEGMAATGEKLYKGGNSASGVAACIACHGPSGAGNPAAKFPALSSQHADYTVAQLQKFAKDQRANDAGKMMRNVAAKMTEAEMAAVAQYIQGLQP